MLKVAQAETKDKNSSWVSRCTLADLVCLSLEKAIGNAVQGYHKRLQRCVSANGENVEYKMW